MWNVLSVVSVQAYASDLKEMVKAMHDAAPMLVRPSTCLHLLEDFDLEAVLNIPCVDLAWVGTCLKCLSFAESCVRL